MSRSNPACRLCLVRTFLWAILGGFATPVVAQFGPPEPPQSGPKLAPPSVFPLPGTFPTTESITLISPEPGAAVHYTYDGSTPTAKSPLFDPQNVLFIAGVYEGDKGLTTHYTIRAVATEDGHKNSDPATFQYTVERRDRTAYISEIVGAGIRMIRDSDNDKMFLIEGGREFALVDSGQGRGDLRSYLRQYTHGLPIVPIFSHNHPDHIGQADQFIADGPEYIGEADRPGAVRLIEGHAVAREVIDRNLRVVHNGQVFDLGGRELVVYEAPGHTPGSIVIFDPQTGTVFSGDSFGSNSPTIPDALWLQWTLTPLDGYLAVIRNVREPLRGKIRAIMTGHNDRPLQGEGYLDNLEAALQQLMDKGRACLVPSYRPAGLLQVVVGDRLHDPNWVAINVNPVRFLPAPVDQISSVSHLGLKGAVLAEPFVPTTSNYEAKTDKDAAAVELTVVPTSSRSRSVRINGRAAELGKPTAVPLADGKTSIVIAVSSPDGSATSTYIVNVKP